MVMAAVSALVYTTLGTATLAPAAQAEEGGKALHIYILTGQSNSLGAVKGDPADADTLAYYNTAKEGDADGIRMWDGNMAGSLSEPTSGGLAWSNEGKAWMTVQPQATPSGAGSHGAAGTPYAELTGNADLRNAWEGGNGKGVMGPEYGFAYMMQKKGWNVNVDNDVAVIKVSRDGGDNGNWVKPTTPGSVNGYTFLLDSVVAAIGKLEPGSYDSVEIDGLMYLQGESDRANTEDITKAKERYQAFLTNLKTDLSAAGINATVSLADSVVGEPATWNGNDRASGGTTTAKELLALSQENDSVGYVYTRDLGKITAGDTMGVHYDGNSEITIGARYAYAMAAEQGLDTTENGTARVRSQKYGDTQLNESAVSLNDAAAWWQSSGDAVAYSAASMADTVAVWDVSSANMGATAQGTETLSADMAVKGIRIEDPYADDDTVGTHNATIAIRNAAGADATLSVGSAGIELQRGNLNVQTKVATTAAQTWTVAGGKELTVGNTISGTDAIALRKHADIDTPAAAKFDFSTATDAGQRTWSIGDGVEVALSDTGFAGSTLAVEESAAAALTGHNVSIGSLTMGNGAALELGAGLTLSAGTVQLADSAQLSFRYSGGSFGTLNAGTLTANDHAAVTIQLGNAGALSKANFTLGTGWSGWTVSDTAGSGKTLSLAGSVPSGYHLMVDATGALVLTGTPTYPDVQKNWVQTPAGAVVTAANNMVAAEAAQYIAGSETEKAVQMTGAGNSSWLLYGAQKTSLGEGQSLYTEVKVSDANFISDVGTFSYGDRSTTVTGDYNMKIASGNSIGAVFGASNITVDGNVYTELSAADATYTNTTYGIVGAFNAKVTGDVSLVINGGQFNNGVNVWGAKYNRNACDLQHLSIEVNGGNLQNIYVADAQAHSIASADIILNGGTVNGSIYGSNTGVTIAEGTSIYIGPDAIVKGDIFGGVANAKEGRVVLHDMGADAAFLTNFGSGKSIYADTLELNDTTIGDNFKGTIHANNITIHGEGSLAAGKLAADTTLSLGGNGSFSLTNGSQALASNVSLADDWAGTIIVNGVNQPASTSAGNTFGFEQLGTADSAVQLINSQFAMSAGTHDYAGRVILGGETATAGGDMRIVFGQSAGGALTYNLSGEVSGKGGITNSWAHSGVTVTFNFTGDVSEWTGSYKQTASSTSHLIFDGAADTVNADITRTGGNLNITAKGTVTFNGALTNISNLNTDGSTAILNGGTHTINSLQGNDTGAAASAIELRNGARVTVSGAVAMGARGEVITVEHGSTLVLGSHNLTLGAAEGQEATFTVTAARSTGRYTYNTNREDFAISHAQVSSDAAQAKEVKTQLADSALTNAGAGALTVSNAANTLTGLHAKNGNIIVLNADATAGSLTSVSAVGGDVTLSGLAAGSSLHLDTLNIAGGQSVSVYFGTPTAEEIQGAQSGLLGGIESSITVSSAFGAGAGAQLNADLIMADGSTLDLSGSVSMGSSVQLGQDMSLILTLTPGENAQTDLIALFEGVEGPVTLGALANAHNVWLSAADVFSSVTINGTTVDPNDYCVGVWNNSILFASAETAPEPATATLSLLALAALAARRKRR